MRTFVPFTAACCLALACSPGPEREIVVTRDQIGSDWPLQVSSARVSCDESGAVLRIGQKRYALDEAALASGLPDAREVAVQRPHPDDPAHTSVPADLAPLRAACDGLAHVASGP